LIELVKFNRLFFEKRIQSDSWDFV
jgi:hypothetical protein